MKFIMIRHGETDANSQGVMQGAKINSSLNKNGRLQALNAYNTHFHDYNFKEVYTSKMARAKETAEIIADKANAKLIGIDGLQEFAYGDGDGIKKTDAHNLYPDFFSAIMSLNTSEEMATRIPNGESSQEVVDRALNALNSIKNSSNEKIVAVVTHMRLMRTIYHYFYNKILVCKNCEFFEIEF